jgi:hypothetical protein
MSIDRHRFIDIIRPSSSQISKSFFTETDSDSEMVTLL